MTSVKELAIEFVKGMKLKVLYVIQYDQTVLSNALKNPVWWWK